MRTINFSLQFNHSLKKLSRKQPEIIPVVFEKVLLFNSEIDHPSLHKLSGKLKEHWSFSIGYDLRIILRYTSDGNILFIDIGTHDQVY